VTDPFRDDATALDERVRQLVSEIDDLRIRLAAYEGENRDAVVAAQLGRLRADIELATVERDRLRVELRALWGD
jgi:hypothetical protein